jgi:hypothetical protein
MKKYDNIGYNCVIISPYEKMFKGIFGEKNFVYNEYFDEISAVWLYVLLDVRKYFSVWQELILILP